MDNLIWIVGGLVAAAVLAPFVWLVFVRRAARRTTAQARRQAARLLEEAEREGQAKIREAELAAKEKLLQARSEFDQAANDQRRRLEDRELKLTRQQEEISTQRQRVDQLHADLEQRSARLGDELSAVEKERDELAELVREGRHKLEQVAGLTALQAKEELLVGLENEARMEAAHLVKRIEDEARERAAREAQRIVGMAIERSASDYVNETTVSVVMLPNDEMKGRIIGREGRNIRALEMATGVDLIVDDTPEAVILSGFDPYRREIARVVLDRLITDGRIHPARIEEVTAKVQAEFEQRVQQEGEAALLELNLANLHHELVRLLGRLRFRTSYGQNVLQHSKEVAFLAGTMAAELGVDVHVAKRAGLVHDIGKAIDREVEGTHLELGIELLRRYGESEAVVHAMACHHGDYDPETVEAVLVTAADTLSAARPGARREILETYMKRLEKLEEIACDFKGVQKSYAMQAGREIRIIVDCKKMSDEEALWLSKDVAKRIEAELTYPGQIKVTVIRESRAVEYAK
jgi:ribonuclease Y